jgi:protocatechuate 3,4-dioxygenase beta subunit
MLWILAFSIALSGCSNSGSGTIDSLFGNFSSAPILTSVPDQIVSQEDLLSIDVNNLKEKTPGDDKGMSYVCYYDNQADGIVDGTKSCADILNSTVAFDGVTGILSWTPHIGSLGNYEVRITGKNADGAYDEIFTVGVRLKFDGIGLFTQITGSSVTINWTPNTSAQGYQVFKLNPGTGQYETLKAISGGGSSGTTVTGLTPNSPYTLRVQAIDALGNFDGNVVSRSFTTTELVKLSMSSTASTLGAGSATTITVTAFNANGSPQTIGGLPVTPAIASGTSSGTFSAVTDNNDGSYTFTFIPNIVGSAITIDVSINISFFLNNIVSLNIIPGPASSANSSISISSNTVVSGNLVTATATVRDAFNNPINSGPVISFTKTGGTSSGNFSAVNNQGNGVYSIAYTGIIAGTAQTLQVKADAAVLTPSTQIQVLPGTPVSVNSTLTISAASIASGALATVTATLKDINNNPVPSGIMVVFNKSGGTSSGNFDSIVNAGSGVYTTTYSGVNAGTAQMLSVSVDGVTLVPVVTVTVVPGAASLANSSLTISSPTVVSGSFATITATLKDINSNPIESATVAFTKTGGTSTGTFNTVTNQGNGVYNIRYTGIVSGTAQTLAVLVNGTSLGASASVTVLTGSPSPTQSTIAISSGSVVSGQAVTVTATMKDENNNPVTSGVAISFSKTGGTSTGTFGAVTNQGAGVYTVAYTGVASGTAQTINVLADGSALGPNTTVAVTNAPPQLANSTLTIGSSSITSGQTTTVTATIKDLNNNPISSGVTVTFSKTGGTSTGTFSAVTNQGAGVYTLTYTGIVAGTAQTIAVLINGTSLGASTSVTVLTGAPSLTQSSIAISSGSVASGQTVTVTATMKDDNNNPVLSGVAISFSKTGGTSTGTFGTVTHQGAGVYTVVYTGIVSGTAQTINVLIEGSALGPSTTVTVVNAPPQLANSTLTIGASSITSGQTTTVTATIKDLNNNPISSGVAVTFTKTSGTSTGTFSAVTNQGSGIYTVTYTGIVAGTAQDIKVLTDAVNLGLNVGVTVHAGSPSAAQSSISVATSSVISGQSVTITGTVRDANSNPITSGVAITFSKTGGSSTGTFSAITNQGAGVYTLTYSGVVAGSAQTLGILADGADLGPTTPITVTPGAPANGLSTLSITSNIVIAGQNVTLTATIKDANSNPISSGILVAFDKIGGTSFGNYSAVVNQGGGVYTATYTGITAGTAQTVQANVNGAGFGPTQSIQVLVGAPSLAHSSLTVSSGTVASGSNISITAVIKDSQNNPITSQYAITLDTIGGSSTGTLSSINNSGTGTFTATYSGSIAGSAQTLRVLADGTPISGLTASMQVIPGPASAANSTFTIASSNVQSSTTTNLSMNIRDANSNAISSGATVTFTKSSGTSDGTLSGVSNTGSGNYTATYTGTIMGATQTINLVVNGTAVGLSVTVTVSAGPPTHFAVVIPAGPNPSIDCTGPYTLTMKDVNENTTNSVSVVTVAPSSTPPGSDAGTLFTDASCSNGVSGFSVPALTSSFQFYYKNYIPSTFTLTLTPTGGISPANISINNYAVLSWMGASAYFTMNGSGSGTVMDDAHGGSWQPYDVTTSGDYLYAVDNTANRIMRYNIVTNTFAGWIGYIGSTEGMTGADVNNTCASPTLGGLTSSWCLGGRVNVTATTLFSALRNITSDSTYIYVSSFTNNRIIRIKQSDGSLQGWIGKIGTTPATSPASCVSAGASATAPTWCFGGTSAVGAADGQFNGPTSLTVYSGKLYVAEYGNHRIQKIDVASGVSEGWVGQAATTPPAAGQLGTCSPLPTVGVKTPGWCLGGTAQVSKRNQGNLTTNPSEVAPPDEGFYNPMGVATDGTYLYVADGNNYRVARLTLSTGAFAGWVGYLYRSTVGTSPTVPVQSSGTYTTTWTSGGVTEARSTNGFGQMNTVIVDSTTNILYVTDNQHRVIRIRSSDGQDLRWIGRAGASPTGGYTGCSSTPISGTNPGWCLNGGGGRYGNTSGTFYNAAGMALTSTKLFVADSSNFRIQRFDLTNGSFDGWIGAGNVPATKWSRGYVSGAAASRGGIDDYSFGDITAAFAGITMNSSHIFLSDVGWHRIKKYNRNEGSFIGYIGQIQNGGGFYPTGPDACVGYTSGMTPDWCTGGGRTTSGAGIHGYNNPYGVTADSTYVYITNYSNHRIDRVRSSDAVYLGWLGQVSTTPTDGAPACLNTNSPSPTPDWCIGGAASAGSTNGKFNAPRAIFYDTAQSVIYAIDNTSRIMKIDPDNGAFLAVTGGMTAGTGCTVTNNVAVGWCTDATGNVATSRYGGLSSASAMVTNGSYIFIADTGNHRIVRFDKTSGAPAGFISKLTNSTSINTSVTGGACNGVTAGYPRVTPGWCSTTTIGLTMNNVAGADEGGFNGPRGIWADTTYVYVADTLNNRLVRIIAATGAFAGWKGLIVSTSGMTDPDCIAAGNGGITPKWCTGGTAGPGRQLGAFDYPSGLFGDTNYIYVYDGRNNRIVTIPK